MNFLCKDTESWKKEKLLLYTIKAGNTVEFNTAFALLLFSNTTAYDNILLLST